MTAILVIGMHRSGTSLVAGALKLVGAYLGPEAGLMQPTLDNTKGYWEHLGFVEIDEKFLDLLGASWYRPPILTPDLLASEAVTALQADARALIAGQFEQQALWACKDPRATVLLPLWRSAIDAPRFALCVRNPLDVAASLEKRDDIPIEHGLALWHIYTLRGLLDTEEANRVIVFYEEVTQNPLEALEPVFALIGAGNQLSDPDVRKSLEEFADSRLTHHRHSLEDFLAHSAALPQTKRLYKALVNRDGPALKEAVADGESTLPSLYAVASGYSLAHEAREETLRIRHELETTQAALQNARDILNSRTHRAASKVNNWLIRIGKNRSGNSQTP